MDWASGYVTDIDYTAGYVAEMNPLRSRLPLLFAGYEPPPCAHACELGFGRGVSFAMHAAVGDAHWWGADINPSHATSARTMVQASGADAQVFSDSFEEFCSREDLPEFDFVGLHGIWSWVDAPNKAILVDFLRRKLRFGGMVYLSYNTMPGWSAMAPLRHMMAEHARRLSAPGAGRLAALDAALDFVDSVLDAEPGLARSLPTAKDRFANVRRMDRQYLIHEYMNAAWTPQYFSEVAESLQSAKLTFACSANTIDAVEPMNFSAKHLEILSKIKDPIFAQTVRDMLSNQQFRRDVWVKGARRLEPRERRNALLSERFLLARPRQSIKLSAPGALGEVRLREDAFGPILDVLADGEARTGFEMLEALRPARIEWRHLVEALLVFHATGDIVPVRASTPERVDRARRLNAHFVRLAETGAAPGWLASPVTGGGVQINRIQTLLLSARSAGAHTPQAQAQAVQAILAGQGERMMQDGKAVDSADAERALLTAMATELAERAPFLDRLGVLAAPPPALRAEAIAA